MDEFDIREMRAKHWASALLPTETIDEVQELEDLFEESLKCQAHHRNPGNEVCSVDVAAIAYSCVPRKYMCANSARYVESRAEQEYPSVTCEGCGDLCRTHWKVVWL
jgi:hypothetical protein